MISKGIFNLDFHDTVRGILVIISVCAGGFLIADFPPKFLDSFNRIHMQFFIFLCINYAARKKFLLSEVKWIFLEAAISVILLQTVKYIVFNIYGYSRIDSPHI
jgi:hypothetical protein